ncbi:hypothetical protein BFW38_06360 [Terasakiispira papahanaumokuakeensis]|uniref:Uncharacterized protein n=1 Tax=Terasakiispira papahanaumokuakeensis TaxID=197479 RepID=A0A1E2VEG7_9GAMM|nr:hypothetical protein BFW38_06360 [Terasakiispira papahanaumokuakeensis]
MMLNQKSRTTSFVLTFLFGPLGLLYASWPAAIILGVIAFVTAVTLVGPAICWVLGMIIGDSATRKHNRGIEEFKALMSQGKDK